EGSPGDGNGDACKPGGDPAHPDHTGDLGDTSEGGDTSSSSGCDVGARGARHATLEWMLVCGALVAMRRRSSRPRA
ncbi:MAG: hypothetical protein ACXWP4_24315, partial [Polyangiales bacterium]